MANTEETAQASPGQPSSDHPGPNRPAIRKTVKIETPEDTLRVIQTSLEDDKAEDITVIALKGKSSLADYMVVATGRSATHVRALSEHVVFQLKHGGFPPLSIAGLENNDWVAVDANDVLLHIFRPEVREFYRLEDMWKKDFAVGITVPEAPLDDQALNTETGDQETGDQENGNQENGGQENGDEAVRPIVSGI